VQGKTKHTQIIQPKNIQKQAQGPTELYELFLLTVPISQFTNIFMRYMHINEP